VIVEPRRAEYGVRVTVDEPGKEHPGHLHHRDGGLRNAEYGMEVAGFATRADPGDALSVD
jgi:ribonuclease PH